MTRGGPHHAAAVLAGMGMPVARRCACGEPVGERGGSCPACHEVETKERRAEDIARRVRVTVPAVYRWATLEPGGALERAASGRSVAEARKWLTDPVAPPVLLLRGITHVYKSTIAAACVRAAIEQGQDASFVLAVDLMPLGERPTHEQQIRLGDALHGVRHGRRLVAIDDIAKVLGGATADSGIAAYRRGHLCAAIHRLWQTKTKLVVTTDLENRSTPENRRPGIVELLGEDILARLVDEKSAVVVRLERKT